MYILGIRKHVGTNVVSFKMINFNVGYHGCGTNSVTVCKYYCLLTVGYEGVDFKVTKFVFKLQSKETIPNFKYGCIGEGDSIPENVFQGKN